MTSIKVSSLDVLPEGSMKQFYVRDLEILVIHSNGKLYGLDARCSHAGAPLEEGTVEKYTLTCPWHGSQFRITDGAVVRGPAEKSLGVFDAQVRDGWVFIEL